MGEESKANDALDLLSNTALMKPSVSADKDVRSSSRSDESKREDNPTAIFNGYNHGRQSEGDNNSSGSGSTLSNSHATSGSIRTAPAGAHGGGSPASFEARGGSPRGGDDKANAELRRTELKHLRPTSLGDHRHAHSASVSSDSADAPQRERERETPTGFAPGQEQHHPPAGAGLDASSGNEDADSPARPFAMQYPGSAFYHPPPGYHAGPPQPAYYPGPPHHHHHHQYLPHHAHPHSMAPPPPHMPHMAARQISPTMHSPYHSKDGGSFYPPSVQQQQHQQQQQAAAAAAGFAPPPPSYMHMGHGPQSVVPKADDPDALAKENQQLRAKLAEKDDHIVHLQAKAEFLEKQIAELRQLPTGKISHIPIDDMIRIMHEYGSEVSNQTLPQRKSNIKKASIVRQFRRWNPEFFRYFIHVNGEWVPKLGKEGEQRRRMEKRRAIKAQKGTLDGETLTM